MKRIPLTQNQFALVDDDLFKMLSQYSWYALKREQTYYAVHAYGTNQTRRSVIYMHQMVYQLRGKPVSITIDHWDGNGLNNQTSNLRPATRRQQQFNKRKRRRPASSRYIGVNWDKQTEQWLVRVSIQERARNLGRYDDEFSAAWVRDYYARKYYGVFVRTNNLIDRRNQSQSTSDERRGTWKERIFHA
jgi:hypothetical protein